MDSVTLTYANAIIALVNEENIDINVILDDLKMFNKVIDDEIFKFLTSKAISNDDKKNLLENSLNINDNSMGFLKVLIDNNRIEKLPSIIDAIEEIINENKGIVRVKVKSSRPIRESERKELYKIAKEKFDIVKDVVFDEEIDASLISGVVLEYNGKLIDASLKARQQSLKEFLEK